MARPNAPPVTRSSHGPAVTPKAAGRLQRVQRQACSGICRRCAGSSGANRLLRGRGWLGPGWTEPCTAGSLPPTTNDLQRATQAVAKHYAVDEASIVRTLREVADLTAARRPPPA